MILTTLGFATWTIQQQCCFRPIRSCMLSLYPIHDMLKKPVNIGEALRGCASLEAREGFVERRFPVLDRCSNLLKRFVLVHPREEHQTGVGAMSRPSGTQYCRSTPQQFQKSHPEVLQHSQTRPYTHEQQLTRYTLGMQLEQTRTPSNVRSAICTKTQKPHTEASGSCASIRMRVVSSGNSSAKSSTGTKTSTNSSLFTTSERTSRDGLS